SNYDDKGRICVIWRRLASHNLWSRLRSEASDRYGSHAGPPVACETHRPGLLPSRQRKAPASANTLRLQAIFASRDGWVPPNAAAPVELLGKPTYSTASLIFADFATENVRGYVVPRGEAAMPSFSLSVLSTIDRLCGQFATALHNAEWQVF